MRIAPLLSLFLVAAFVDAKKCTPKTSEPAPTAPVTTAPAITSAPTTAPTGGESTATPTVPTVAPNSTTAAPAVTTAAPAATTGPPPAPTNATGGGGEGSSKVLSKGTGGGTYYYDANGGGCHEPSFPENKGITFCESWTDTGSNKKLEDYHNNYIVAMDQIELAKRRDELCGKRVKVSYKGKAVPGDFVIWDACGACKNGERLDFSATGLQLVDPEACALGVVPGVSWEVVDDQLMPFKA